MDELFEAGGGQKTGFLPAGDGESKQ